MSVEIEGLGEGPKKEFRLVYNDNASAALDPGDVVMYSVVSESPSFLGQSVQDATAAALRVAGVVIGLSQEGAGKGGSIPAGKWGYIQVSGFCDFVTTDGTIAEGDGMIAAAAVADQGAMGTNDAAFFGVALDADSSTTLTSAILKCA